jgi:hypothetical protein
MVYNITKHAKLPFSNATIHTKNSSSATIGKGMGSVLLSVGGPGSASSYIDVDDYQRQTGRQVFNTSEKGQGLSKISSKLSKLNLETGLKKGKRKNITMSI